MEKFIVSARKYRPQHFSTVIGQEHITTTLKNAIKNNQLAHAFLFCGPRGVGKTTCARILAKTINCENHTADHEACDTCNSCVSFNEGTSLNIHELDAASNNSVDDIRSLVEQVRFAPQAGRYKVYIVDEVHMLSSSAFNAFLKTLEEPPPYAIFILATTEKHKILPTILSRCQIFDFKRITANDTVAHLEEICAKEDIQADKAALHIIAQKSEGCMRDALSILDKIVSFTNGSLTYQNTLEHLNILDAEYYFKFTESMLQQDLSAALLLYEDINRKGFEGDLVLNGFAEFFRNLLVCKDEKVAALLEVVESFKDLYISMAKKVSAPYIISALNILNETELSYKSARNKRLHVELALIKLCYLQQALQITANGEGLSKKKIAETSRPMAFRSLPIVEIGMAPQKNVLPPITKAVTENIILEDAKLIIENAVPVENILAEKKTPYTQLPPTTVTESIPASKLGALGKIRQQYVNTNPHAQTEEVKPLTLETLAPVWQQYAQQLRIAKNPALQSFDMASFRIKDNNSFDIVTPNNLQQKFIEQERLNLSQFLQQQFCNKKLTYTVLVEHNPDLLPKIELTLNSREQYIKIIEQYPLVKELRDRLRMELDF